MTTAGYFLSDGLAIKSYTVSKLVRITVLVMSIKLRTTAVNTGSGLCLNTALKAKFHFYFKYVVLCLPVKQIFLQKKSVVQIFTFYEYFCLMTHHFLTVRFSPAATQSQGPGWNNILC